ncbi:TBC domain containing protein, putative [Babesia ovis]|uniref:TBC domain containing protein, putative n=1 Tax=Babesia ovis TaxID=5869 RepID=A0A9W5T863_BABOV|nr:TBC domain containing protein, putative [Babesia ovis]
MLLTEGFWEAERKSSLFSRSGAESRDDLLSLLPRVSALLGDGNAPGSALGSVMSYITSLLSACSLWDSSNQKATVGDLGKPLYEVTPDNERIFRLDAERTFILEDNRDILCKNLREVFGHVGDYHQGEGFVVAFLSLYLPTTDVVRLVVHLHENQMRGYFSCIPEAYVRDSRVLMKLLEERHWKLHEHINGLLVPETFCSKWFIGMNIHVFPFKHVVTYMERVLSRGDSYIFSFGLAFLLFHAETILATTDVSRILELLRLDDAVLPVEPEREAIYTGILQLAEEQEVETEKIQQLRVDVQAEMDRQKAQREQRMKELEDTDDEIVFSDEE